jgi:hypothetical protein
MSYTLDLRITQEELDALCNEETLTFNGRKRLRKKGVLDLIACARQEKADLEAIDAMVIEDCSHWEVEEDPEEHKAGIQRLVEYINRRNSLVQVI